MYQCHPTGGSGSRIFRSAKSQLGICRGGFSAKGDFRDFPERGHPRLRYVED